MPRDDLSQQILIALPQSLPRYDRKQAKFRVWLSTIVRNKANSYFREYYSNQRSLHGMSNERQVHDEITIPEIEIRQLASELER